MKKANIYDSRHENKDINTQNCWLTMPKYKHKLNAQECQLPFIKLLLIFKGTLCMVDECGCKVSKIKNSLSLVSPQFYKTRIDIDFNIIPILWEQ